MPPAGFTGYRFDSFEVQLRTRVLMHKNYRVRIQRLPFQMLLMLLERPGELVSRDELCAALWNDETFVDFDNSLYVAAAKLRAALGDDPAAPRYVKTVSRQGYQFVAEVTAVAAVEAAEVEDGETARAAGAENEREAGMGSGGGSGGEPGAQTPPAVLATAVNASQPRSHFPIRSVVAAAVVAATLCGLLLYIYWNRPLASATDKVLLGDVLNATGEPSLDGAFSSALRFKLEESPFLSLIDDRRFRREAWNNSTNGRSQGGSLEEELAACAGVGAQLFLSGEIVSRSSGYRVELGAWRCRDGRLLTTQSADAASQSEILQALETAALSMRRRLGEPEASLEKFNAPLVQATTSSLAALKAFTNGEMDRLRGKTSGAAANYKLAVDLDPRFALAYARLGSIYNAAQDGALGREYFRKAFDLRERTTDREKLYIAAHYYSDVLGDLPRGIGAYQLWESLYPRDVIPVENLGNIFDVLGEPEQALALEEKAVRMRPDGSIRYALLAVAEFEAGRYAELTSLCNDPRYGQIDEAVLHASCYLLAFGKHDDSAMQRQLAWAQCSSQQSAVLEFAAWAQMSRGRLADARRTFAEAIESAMQNHLTDFAAELNLDEGWQDADLGFAGEARAHATEALRLASGKPAIEAFAALALARSGDAPRANAAIASVSDAAPRNTVLITGVLPAARAAEALAGGDFAAAIRLLERSRPTDNVSSLALAPAYYRGLAYMGDHRYDDAVREFQSVADHRALMPESLYVPLSLLQLGHALQALGHREEALKDYRLLEQTWAGADANFPPLRQLKLFERKIAR